MIFAPDDFAGRPYEGANNQAMHCVFGAAIVGVLLFAALPVWLAVSIALGVILAWEAHQLLRRGATRADYRADLFYWWAGVIAWAWLHSSELVVLSPIVPLVLWLVEYRRLS